VLFNNIIKYHVYTDKYSVTLCWLNIYAYMP